MMRRTPWKALNPSDRLAVELDHPARRGLGLPRQAWLAVSVLFYAVVTAAGVAGDVDPRAGLVDLDPSQAIPVIALAWPSGRQWRAVELQRLAAVSGLILAIPLLQCALVDGPLLLALRDALVALALAWGFVAAYRAVCRGVEWFPARGGELGALFLCCALHTTVMGFLGGLPGTPTAPPETRGLFVLGEGGSGSALAWWWCVEYATVVFTVLIDFALTQPLRRFSGVEFRRTIPAGLVLGSGCLLMPALYPSYPLEWMLFVPALWIGLTLPPRGALLASVVMPLSVVLRERLGGQPTLEPTADNALLSLLLAACAGVVAVIVAHRERVARLVTSVDAATRDEAEAAALADAVIASMDDGMLLIDGDGAVVLSNPAARAMLGRSSLAGGGTGWLTGAGFRRQDGGPLTGDDEKALTRPPYDADARLTLSRRGGDGAEWVYTVSARALTGGHTELAGPAGASGQKSGQKSGQASTRARVPQSLVVLTDTTPEYTRHRELEAFAGDVAHDLKGPLAAISVWMDTAEYDAADDVEAGRYALRRATQASARMADTIDECLAFTIAQSGVVRPREVDLHAVVREVASIYATRGATVEVGELDVVRADPALARRLIGNLIGNSVKYAKPGEPAWIRVSATTDEVAGWVRVFVEDRGIGIDTAAAERIFDRFARTADGSATGEGTGLGLALCRSIVELHHGTITAHSNEWGGATFEFTLPQGRVLVR